MRTPALLFAFFVCIVPGLCLAGDDLHGRPLYEVKGRPPAPDFTLEDTEGEIHRLSEYRGKVVILNFWATWCPPCRDEMPSMQRAWEGLRERGIEMLAINVGEDEDIIFTFTADYPADYPLLLDREGTVIKEWPVLGLPTTFVIDREGRIAYRAVGGRDWEDPLVVEPLMTLAK